MVMFGRARGFLLLCFRVRSLLLRGLGALLGRVVVVFRGRRWGRGVCLVGPWWLLYLYGRCRLELEYRDQEVSI